MKHLADAVVLIIEGPSIVSQADCFAQVFDLAHNKAEPLSAQKVVGKAALTRLAFNAHHPILLVGDDKCVRNPLSIGQACLA